MANETKHIPTAVTAYLDAANRFDAAGAAACFTPNAVVRDEHKDYIGSPAIERWVSQTSLEYRPRVTETSTQMRANTVRMAVRVTGDFPGSPVALDYEFRLQDGKIAQLDIR